MKPKRKNSGFIFIDIIIAVALISIALVALLDVGAKTISISSSLQKTTQANFLLKEEAEALRSYRDATEWAESGGIGTVSTGSDNPYYLAKDTLVTPYKWNLVSGAEITGNFTRSIVFNKVSRDPVSKNIQESYNPSNDDPNTIKAIITVVLNSKTYQIVLYLTNWQNEN